MKAVILNQYGPAEVLTLADRPVPKLKPNQVLVRNYYTTVNPMDTQVRNGRFRLFAGRKLPKILGVENAGVIEEVGQEVTTLHPGDRVMAALGFRFGTYAEYTAVDENSVFPLPCGVTFKQGSTLTMAACTAYCSLYLLGKIQSSDEVLINGAFGGVGSFAVQLAKLAGARVTGVCSTENIDGVKALMADEVIDYTRQDVYAAGKRFDLIVDAVGKLDARKARRLLQSGGRMVTTVGGFREFLFSICMNAFSSRKFNIVWNRPNAERMSLLAGWVAEGKLQPVIDREYSLEALPEAHGYSETGKAKGKILIKIYP